MKTISLTFELHVPINLKRYRFFDIGVTHDYLDIGRNRTATRRMAAETYMPMNEMLERALKRHGEKLRIGIYVSGTAMEQFRSYAPEVIKGLKRIAATGCAEFIGGTYSYSLSSLADAEAFAHEAARHTDMIISDFGQLPETFYNTTLLYSDEIGGMVATQGYKNMLIGGTENLLGWKSPGYVYANAINQRLKLLARNERIFKNLSASNMSGEIEKAMKCSEGELINIITGYCSGYEYGMTGEEWVGVCESLIERMLHDGEYEYALPKECGRKHQPVGLLHAETPCTGNGKLSELLGNELQQEAFAQLYARSAKVLALAEKDYTHVWEFMQSCEHFERMSLENVYRGTECGDSAAYEAFINYMNIISDFTIELEKQTAGKGMKFEHMQREPVEYEYEFS